MWLLAGGSENGAMHTFGWRSRQMLSRYGASAAAERAREEHRRLSPADKESSNNKLVVYAARGRMV